MASNATIEESDIIVDSPLINDTNTNDNSTSLNWASEWFGYLALCMFSLVLIIPTLGIFGLMIWEYFSDEAERKAERKKEIDQAMEHFGGQSINDRKQRRKRKRLERLQRLQEQENEERLMNNENDETKLDDIQIDDLNDDTNVNANTDYNDFDMDLFDESDTETDDSNDEANGNLNDVDNVLKHADFMLHRRKRNINSMDDNNLNDKFDEILT